MSVNYDKHKLHENVKRQSKRLAKLLDVPLAKAQFLLSAHVYSEPSYAEIRSKIENGHLSGKLHFALVASDAEQHVFDIFAKEFGDLYLALEESPVKELYNGTIRELIFDLFDLKPEKISSAR